jgi:DNA-binding MarR family transcriptional regulator
LTGSHERDARIGIEIDDLLRRAAANQRLQLERALAAVGLTPPQHALLAIIVAIPGCSGADVARIEGLTPQTVSVILRNLERDGLIARRAHATHGRIRQLFATTEGADRFTQGRDSVQALKDKLSLRATRDDAPAIRAWLAKAGPGGA